MSNPNPDSGNPVVADPAVTTDPAAKPAGDPAASTILNDKGGDPVVTAPADWPADWRDKLAGDDKEALKQLGTFKSPAELNKAYRALQQKLSSGEFKKPAELPENATPEQLAAYRKDIGVPDTVDGYSLDFGDGLVVGEEDKPVVMEILKDVHAAHVPEKFVKPIMQAYFRKLEAERAAQVDFDNDTWSKTEETLRAEFGGEFKVNQTAINNYLKTLPEEFQSNLAGARLADGRKLLGSVDGINMILSLARDANPAITVVPGSTNPMKSIDDELSSLKVGTDEYWADPKKVARATELITAREKMKPKQA